MGGGDGLRVGCYERNERATISEGMPMILSNNPLAIPKSMSPIFSLLPVRTPKRPQGGWVAGRVRLSDKGSLVPKKKKNCSRQHSFHLAGQLCRRAKVALHLPLQRCKTGIGAVHFIVMLL